MEEKDLLNDLRELAGEGPRQASPRVEARVMAQYRARNGRVKPRWIAAAAAALVILGAAFYLGRHTVAPAEKTEFSRVPDGFLALPYAQSGVPLEDAVVMRVSVKESQLESMGIPSAARNPGRRVNAELLVGQDGVARAIRLVE
jgi:hypothetical protein